MYIFCETLKTSNLQEQYVIKCNVGHGSVNREHEAGIVELRTDFSQTEHCKSPVVAFIFEMVRVPPHQRES